VQTWRDAARTVLGGDADGAYGRALPDLDGDGLAELALLEPGLDVSGIEGAGRASIFFSPLPEGSVAPSAADLYVVGGWSDDGIEDLGSPGDTDEDGLPELIVCSAGYDESATDGGGAFLFLDLPSAQVPTTDADVRLLGSRSSEPLGSLGPPADLDADGVADVLVGGVPERSDAPAVWAVLGPLAPGAYEAETADLRVRSSEAAPDLGDRGSFLVLDADGDAIDDLALGCAACTADAHDDAGAVSLYTGAAW
jgi:hypothetical protein